MDNAKRSTDDGGNAAADVYDFATFWARLAESARLSGLSKSEWAIQASKLAGRHAQTGLAEHKPFSAKTLYDRTQHGRRVEWDEAQWFVRAIAGLDAPSWKAAWERAEQRWLSAAKDEPPLPAAEVDSVPARRSPIEFRVCVGKRGQPIPEETCGAWTMQPG